MALTTLPKLSIDLGESLDALRELVRGDQHLRTLGVKVGAARGYTPEDVVKIKAALAAKRARRKKATA